MASSADRFGIPVRFFKKKPRRLRQVVGGCIGGTGIAEGKPVLLASMETAAGKFTEVQVDQRGRFVALLF